MRASSAKKGDAPPPTPPDSTVVDQRGSCCPTLLLIPSSCPFRPPPRVAALRVLDSACFASFRRLVAFSLSGVAAD